MKIFNFLIISITVLNCANLIETEELLELNCFNEVQCKQFQHSGIKSLCIEDHCQCTTSSEERVKCKPSNLKVNNIIGGPCPCQQLNAECDKQQDICYCARNYTPSSDKRRCMKKMATLGEKCELDLQCQSVDVNAICQANTKQCACMDQFVNDEGKCASVVGNKSFCSEDQQCTKQYGVNTKCYNATQQCICMAGYFASVDNSQCLKINTNFFENCTENIQCIGSMGLGGKCQENICQCSEKYFAEIKIVQNDTKTVCTAVVERGQYCRYAEDCYQRQLNESEQSMDCSYGECNCKMGFNSYNNGECYKGSAGIKSSIEFSLMMGSIISVNAVNMYVWLKKKFIK